MSVESQGKLNQLQHLLPEGLVVDSAWLKAQGYSAQLCNKYVASGWLERVAHGIYRKPGGPLLWQPVVISLQVLMGHPLLVGGRTALALHGFSHYAEWEDRHVHLHGPQPPPGWLGRLPLPQSFHYHNSETLFSGGPVSSGPTSLAWKARDSRSQSKDSRLAMFVDVMPWGQWEWPLTLSTPERATLEMLNALPNEESFEMADRIFESLATLRPRYLQRLLADCGSIKVKRLFFFFADRHNHPWRKYLHKEDVDLGHGKRMLVRGGRLDPDYLITVPEGFHGHP